MSKAVPIRIPITYGHPQYPHVGLVNCPEVSEQVSSGNCSILTCSHYAGRHETVATKEYYIGCGFEKADD